MALPRKLTNTGPFDRVELNVWDIETKTIIFTGTYAEVANRFNWPKATVQSAYQRKNKLYGKYAIRTAKAIKTEE